MLLLLAACVTSIQLGDVVVSERDDGGLDVALYTGKSLVSDLRFSVGSGNETYEMEAGSYRQTGGTTEWETVKLANRQGDGLWIYDLVDEAGAARAQVSIVPNGSTSVVFQVAAAEGNRVRFDAACTGNDHFVGGGEHAFDVDHVGEAFDLWVSEPGIGKTDTETAAEDWFITGTRHASSYPDPFFIRPEPVGILVGSNARVSVDLCSGDRWTLDVAASTGTWTVAGADTPMQLVEAHALGRGAPAVPPDWAFGAWADAIRGSDRVRAVATELRAAGAAATVIWSEDWRGGEDGALGYHPKPEWAVDEGLYPEPSALDAELEASGFKWLAYFAPFLVEGTAAWSEGIEYAIQDDKGEPYTFLGPSLQSTTTVDLTDDAGFSWAVEKMRAAREVGFDGWMADYGEWLPPDAVLQGGDASTDHNAWPLLWQSASAAALDGEDATFFARSGWTGSAALAPVHWPGDQRTSFDADDGLPSVVPLMLGDAVAGVPFVGSDVAGYQSVGNDPSTKELWMRWVAVGAFSPVLRTHHGAYSDEDWQFDSDEETLASFAWFSRVHAALFPYLRALAADAATDGTPLVRPIFLEFPKEDWGRTDAWMLGPDLLVAPVLEAGVDSRQVDLPSGVTWYSFWDGSVQESGTANAPLGTIPVYAPAGAIIPQFATPPDSLVAGPLDGVTTLSDADTGRVVSIFSGAKGSFTEADGTSYVSDGAATSSGEATGTFQSGKLEAGGLTVTINGPTPRTYTIQVWR